MQLLDLAEVVEHLLGLVSKVFPCLFIDSREHFCVCIQHWLQAKMTQIQNS
jgi:hypothetical protein